MKISLFHRAALVAVILGFAAMGNSSAQAPAATNPPTEGQPPPPLLDNDEMVQLQKVREQVLGANPDLQAEEVKLKQVHDHEQNQNPPATPEERNAMFAEWKAYQKKMRGLMLKIDPTLAPIFAKLDKARKNGTAPTPFQPATAK
jgi:hypothetical protein